MERTVLGRVRTYSETEPTPPESGWEVGAEWVVEVEGTPREVRVWNGTQWVHAQYLADEILIPGEDGAIQLKDGTITTPKLAVGVLNGLEVHAMQFYGGYIEAPVIASSDKLGSGSNVLNDPTFQSGINTAWVASGHLGDAPKTHVDTITWSQSYPWKVTDTLTINRWHQGNGTARLNLKTGTRGTGTILFSNFGWVPANRSMNNWYAFPTAPSPYIGAGKFDPTWKTPGFTPTAGTAKTTYLTNSGTFAVASGERWNARIGFTPIQSTQLDLVSLYIEVINAATSAVLWSRAVTDTEKRAGQVNDWWDATFTGNVRFRVRATYTAAGGGAERLLDIGSYARVYDNGVLDSTWTASAEERELPYGYTPANWNDGAIADPEIIRRAWFQLSMTSALFAKVQPQKGWRLTEEGGFELFSTIGARTGRLDGEDNYLNGRFATQETGLRAEMTGASVNVTNLAGGIIGQLYSDGTESNLAVTRVRIGTYEVPTEVAMLLSAVTVRSGYTLDTTSSWVQRRTDGFVRGAIAIRRNGGSVLETGVELGKLPTLFRPAGAWEGPCAVSQGGGAFIGFGQITTAGSLILWSAPAANARAVWNFEFRV
ncbi:hypothetical protein [Leucobacter ruminantium]|uniref:Uncharacterized protein n=1 Tax=Leucobacter ruminantium TaxID=1289170 RepID=A0A939LXC4_9MICO|nr:hypothetical protein [Leucobacter ruminantium]MBO1805831.1 hypothetical protein [Leucobacter ruminantium]